MGDAYHHGNLRSSLLNAASDLLAEQGVEGFSLREVARRAGVSAAAPKHHFRDARALLTTLATTAFEQLGAALEQADQQAGPGRADRIRAQGQAYLGHAVRRPAEFDLMWRSGLLDLDDPHLLEAKARAYAAIDRVASGPVPPEGADKDPRTLLCWSVVHGLARLVLDGALDVPRQEAEAAGRRLLPAVLDLLVLGVAPAPPDAR